MKNTLGHRSLTPNCEEIDKHTAVIAFVVLSVYAEKVRTGNEKIRKKCRLKEKQTSKILKTPLSF